jgi:hypothetical protein
VLASQPEEGLQAGEHLQRRGGSGLAQAWTKTAGSSQSPRQALKIAAMTVQTPDAMPTSVVGGTGTGRRVAARLEGRGAARADRVSVRRIALPAGAAPEPFVDADEIADVAVAAALA